MNPPILTMMMTLTGGIRMKIETVEDVRTAERFADMVRAMREAQRNCYRLRDPVMAAHAREMERDVDRQLDLWEWERVREEAREKHPELFPGKQTFQGAES